MAGFDSSGWIAKRMDICADECGANPVDCVPNEEVVAHYGEEESYRNAPRPHLELGMSIQRGEWEAEELCRHIFASPPDDHVAMATVRHTTAGALRQAGFNVIHTPGRLGNQKAHATVARPGDDGLLWSIPWSKRVSDLFDQCFNG